MTVNDLHNLLCQRNLVLDGAIGTSLQQAGMPPGVCPEQWCLQNQTLLQDLHQRYAEAGADIVYTATFGANALKLAEFSLQSQTSAINTELVQICRRGVGNRALIAGSIGPSGHLLEPFGETPFEDAVAAFAQQIQALVSAGVDLLVIETMADIQEARAALIAATDLCDLPVMVSLTFGDDCRTLSGTSPAAAVVTLQSLGAAVIGCNCSSGPAEMQQIIRQMRTVAQVPLLAKPNAGIPRLRDGKTVFDMTPEAFAKATVALVDSGASLIGGCCGTNATHISRLHQAITARAQSQPCYRLSQRETAPTAVSSSQAIVEFGHDRPLVIIGERINPTGKSDLKEQLRQQRFTLVRQFALQQREAGAAILDVNVGVSGVDEAATLRQAVMQLACLTQLPLCLDSTDPAAVEAALRIYPGRALLNSISAETAKAKALLPLVARYGACFIFLPINDNGIAETAAERLQILDDFTVQATGYGCRRADIVVDALVMSVSANDQAAWQTLQTVAGVSERGYHTVLGLSNVSFGLPQRSQLNSVFLSMAAAKGLTAAIANPCIPTIIAGKRAVDLLRGVDPQARSYLEFATPAAATAPAATIAPAAQTPEQLLFQAVLTGDCDQVRAALDVVLQQTTDITAKKILDTILIPAITEAGQRFDQHQFYLPQLMSAARAMKIAFDQLQPLLLASHSDMPEPTPIVLATVKGDIHDIGKNIVALLLRNHGFAVIDLGKDVAAEQIVTAVRDSGAALVGLSALMTTTMHEMAAVITACRQAGFSDVQFLVGGAVLDAEFAAGIGAHYAADAVAAVRLAQQLCFVRPC